MALAGSLYMNAQTYTRADTLRGSITPERAWWDVMRYDMAFAPHFEDKYLEGVQRITFLVLDTGSVMQIDLQKPMRIDSLRLGNFRPIFRNEGDVWYAHFEETLPVGDTLTLHISFSGKPREARQPPWDGGWIWAQDLLGRPWMTVACQGIGASVWMPCKDHQSDEPDLGASISITVPDSLVAVANGRLVASGKVDEGLYGYAWEVVNPINSYNMVPYIGKYVHFGDNFEGLKGNLSLDYWVLDYELESAQPHFTQVHRMLACFEDWFGPYPFYEDGYKLVQSSHLGMEHQSAIAYGNQFKNGYRGMDLSHTGWGLKWDFIIIHESGHEWFGNSITTADIADMWVHEAFTSYSESIFVECNYGVQAGEDYAIGTRRGILNDKALIGTYGVHSTGSGDMYRKGANLIHTIRHIMHNDSLFKAMMRGINNEFYHSIVTSEQVEQYISTFSGMDFGKVFDQYLRTPNVPALEYNIYKGQMYYRWVNCVEDFAMPLRLGDGTLLHPLTTWQAMPWTAFEGYDVAFDRNFYIMQRRLIGLPPSED